MDRVSIQSFYFYNRGKWRGQHTIQFRLYSKTRVPPNTLSLTIGSQRIRIHAARPKAWGSRLKATKWKAKSGNAICKQYITFFTRYKRESRLNHEGIGLVLSSIWK